MMRARHAACAFKIAMISALISGELKSNLFTPVGGCVRESTSALIFSSRLLLIACFLIFSSLYSYPQKIQAYFFKIFILS
jgi:NADH:ubiquinone oxidoreductase subunit K